MSAATDVAIIGAGPYGLSIAAHLRGAKMDHRILGVPMQNWLSHMPKGMLLKSEGFASNLYDPGDHFTLKRYCAQHGIEYADLGLPVSLETFGAYGLDFQRTLVPHLENTLVVGLGRSPAGFLVQLADGQSFTARRVVVATGISHFQHVPAALTRLPAELMSHSSEHRELERFRGRHVTVVGGGSSAVDIAALLHEAGASVLLVVRADKLDIHAKMRLPRKLRDHVRWPMTGIGPSWRSLFYANLPGIFRRLPEETRLHIVKTHLGPAGGWFMKDRIAPVATLLGFQPHDAEIVQGRVLLRLSGQNGEVRDVQTDHVVAATGYRVDLRRLAFLSGDLRDRVRAVEHTPVLGSHFESSVPGLYFVGPVAANSFGPVMRFAYGAKYTTPHIARHLTRTAAPHGKISGSPMEVADLLAPTDR